MNSTRRSLAIALQALGTCAEDVADVLECGGWYGYRNDSTACPISAYLRAVVPGAAWAAVSETHAIVKTTDGDEIEADMTPGASEFVVAFDEGDFSDLAVLFCDHNGDVADPDL